MGRVLLAAILAFLSAELSAEDFAGALARAYTSNPDLGISRSKMSATDHGVSLALAARRPSAVAFVMRGRAVYKQWPYAPVDDPSALREFHYQQSNSGVNISQPLYAGGGLDAQLEGADAQVLAMRATLQQSEQQVLLAAAAAYLDLWLAERKLAIQRDNEKDLTLQREVSQRQFQRKDITMADLGQSETRLAQAISNRVQRESALADARANYLLLIGVEPGQLAGLPVLQQAVPELEEALSRALDNNPSIAAALQGNSAAVHNIELQKAGWKPSVSLDYLKFSSRGTAAGIPRLDQQSLLLKLNLPIYQGGAVGARVRTAREQAGKAEIGIEETRRSVVQSTANAWYSLQALNDAVASFHVQISAAELALKGVDLAASHGTRTVLDKLNARMELENARLSLEQAEHDRILSHLQLLAAMGELNAQELGLPVQPHQLLPHSEQSTSRWSDWDWPR